MAQDHGTIFFLLLAGKASVIQQFSSHFLVKKKIGNLQISIVVVPEIVSSK